MTPADEQTLTAEAAWADWQQAERAGYFVTLVRGMWAFGQWGNVLRDGYSTADAAVVDAVAWWREEPASCDACGDKSTCRRCS